MYEDLFVKKNESICQIKDLHAPYNISELGKKKQPQMTLTDKWTKKLLPPACHEMHFHTK